MIANDTDLDFADFDDLDFDDAPAADARPHQTAFKMRDYQVACINAIDEGFKTYTRLLAVLGTGGGKTIIFSQIAAAELAAGGRVLILAHTEELLDQAATKLEKSTGLTSAREKADDHADMRAGVVIASVQTLARDNRLTAFPDDHFTLIIVDEAHRSLAKSYLKILNYFHHGKHSLDEAWKAPDHGVEYPHKAKVLGVTATPDRGDKRSLGEFFQGPPNEQDAPQPVFDYGLLQLCRDGYLVRPVSVQVPLKIDMKGVKVSRSAAGSDFDVSELTRRITPFLQQIAHHIVEHAMDRKIVCFLPGIETARLLSEALLAEGMSAKFVSGACPDRTEKLEWFGRVGAGHCICNAMLLTEGWDEPDVSCVCVLRPTKIRSLYTQMVGRGTRTLPGIIDGLTTREERLAAISRSSKRDLRILDFLWLSDRLDLVQPIDLVANTPQVRDQMLKAGAMAGGDLLNMVETADRDLLKSLEAAAKKNSKKVARTIDPLAWAVSIGDAQLAEYEPQSAGEARAATPGQLALLARNKIDTGMVKCFGHASKLIDRVLSRQKLGLCTVPQLNFMKRLGIYDSESYLLTLDAATRLIDATLAAKNARAEANKECPILT